MEENQTPVETETTATEEQVENNSEEVVEKQKYTFIEKEEMPEKELLILGAELIVLLYKTIL